MRLPNVGWTLGTVGGVILKRWPAAVKSRAADGCACRPDPVDPGRRLGYASHPLPSSVPERFRH